MPFYSIIVPIYNKEKTLEQCIQSVLSQTCNDWELLLIDDGSKDKSLTVANNYASSAIQVLHHENHGVSYTRNRGIKEAKGEYLIFLDADDYYEPSFLEHIQVGIQNNQANIYLCGITKVHIAGNKEVLRFPIQGLYTSEKVKEQFFTIESRTGLFGYVANKIISNRFIKENHILFNEKMKNSEDFLFFLDCYKKCKTFFFMDECGYNYIHYPSGTSIYGNVDYTHLIAIKLNMFEWIQQEMTKEDKERFCSVLVHFAKCIFTESRNFDRKDIQSKIDYIHSEELLLKALSSEEKNQSLTKHILHKDIVSLQIICFMNGLKRKLYKLIHS